MIPRDSALWQKYKDYQLANAPVEDANDQGLHWVSQILDYAERWAGLMEQSIAAGSTVRECAEATSFEANPTDQYSITLFMFQAAVRALVGFWRHGEELRQWHNARFTHPNSKSEAPEGAIVDCAGMNTPMGQALLVGEYDLLRGGMDAYNDLRVRSLASVMLGLIEMHYDEFVHGSFSPHKGMCPNCLVLVPGATAMDGTEKQPGPGSVLVCVYCAAISRMDRDGKHVLLTKDELQGLVEDDAEAFLDMSSVWWRVRNNAKMMATATTQ